MILIAPHNAAFFQQRLPGERAPLARTPATPMRTRSRLLFEYASDCIKVPLAQLHLKPTDAPLVVNSLTHLATTRGDGGDSTSIHLAAIKSSSMHRPR